MEPPQLDRFEVAMLEQLQADGRMTVSDLAAAVGLSATPCARRFEALRDNGIIKGFQALISRRKVGLMVEVFVQVRLVSHSDDSPDMFIAAVDRMDEVSSCWTMTGDYDFLLHVMVPSVDDLNEFVMNRLMKLKGVRDLHTQLVLRNIKGPGHVPRHCATPAAGAPADAPGRGRFVADQRPATRPGSEFNQL